MAPESGEGGQGGRQTGGRMVDGRFVSWFQDNRDCGELRPHPAEFEEFLEEFVAWQNDHFFSELTPEGKHTWFVRLDQDDQPVPVPDNLAYLGFLAATRPEQGFRVSCHRAAMFGLGLIDLQTLLGRSVDSQGLSDFSRDALAISAQEFRPVGSLAELEALIQERCGAGEMCLVQIANGREQPVELLHSFLVNLVPQVDGDHNQGKIIAYEKIGIYGEPFRIPVSLAAIFNETTPEGAPIFQNMLWRVMPSREIASANNDLSL